MDLEGNPDFVKLAEAHGAHGARVERTAEIAPAFAAALDADRPTLIEIMIDKGEDGVTLDVTAKAQLTLANPALARLDKSTLHPQADGETTLQVGYEDPSHFSRAFRRLAGVSPKQYRAQRCRQ